MVKKTVISEEKKVQETVPNKDLDVYQGEFKDRRYGIRIDDDIEVTVIAGNDVIRINGRLLSMKEEIELLDLDGNYIQIMADWVVAIKVLKHNRPPPDQDQELTKKPPIRPKPKKPVVDHAYY